MELQNTNHAYLCGVLTSKLKFIAYNLQEKGLLKAGKLDEALELALQEIAQAEEMERKFTKGA